MMAQVLGRCWIFCMLSTMYLQACLAGELEETKAITERLATMKPRAVTPLTLFSITQGKQLPIVSKLPMLGSWIQKKINNSYKIDDAKLFDILVNGANLLRVISLSCEDYGCKKDVVILQSKYQDLLYSLERACDLLYRDALLSIKESKIGLLMLARKKPWNAAKQMNLMLARQETRIQNRKNKLRPIMTQLIELLQKVPKVIGNSEKKANNKLTTQISQTTKLRNGLKSLKDAVDKLAKDIKKYEASIPVLKKEKESKIKAKEILGKKIDKRKACVKKRQETRSSGSSYWITTDSKDGKFALRTSSFPDDDTYYSANVENKQGIKTSGNKDYAQMYLELQRDGKYKIFSKKHGGVLYCSKGKNDKSFVYFSKNPEHEGGEIWELMVYENPIYTIFNSECRNNLCVKVDKYSGEGKAMVSSCRGTDDNQKWRILKEGVDEYEETPSPSPSPTESGAKRDTEQKEYTCPTFKPGYGNTNGRQVGTERITAEECEEACKKKSKVDPTINAVSIEIRYKTKGKCFCQSLVTKIEPYEGYQTCYLGRAEGEEISDFTRKLKPQELPKTPAVDCGKKIDESGLTTISQEIRSIEDRISWANLNIENKKNEIQMKNIEIGPKKASLKNAEAMVTQAKQAIGRLSRASKAFPTFLKAMCVIKEYVQLRKMTLSSEKMDTTAVIPAPSPRDQTIRFGYTWLAYGLATYESYKKLGPAKTAATNAYLERSSTAEKEAFLSKSEVLLKKTNELVNDYASSRSICKPKLH